jgi:hypothetical protein
MSRIKTNKPRRPRPEPLPPCPDCAAEVKVDNALRHEDGCPAAKAMDAMTDRDIAYFQENPGVESYTRELLPGDLGVSNLDCLIATRPLTVNVLHLGPGLRARHISLEGAVLFVTQDDGTPSLTGQWLAAHLQDSGLTPAPDVLRRKFEGGTS